MTAQDDLRVREAIKGLLPRIERLRGENITEQDTKSDLIDPALKVLGWDTGDHDQVRHEFRAQPDLNPVDYALMVRGRALILVEAKRLGENLSDIKWIKELLSNMIAVGGEWGVLTDGNKYHVYKANISVDAHEKFFREVCISDNNNATASTLSLLSRFNMQGKPPTPIDIEWAVHFVDRRVRVALQDMLNVADTGLIHLIRQKFPEPKPKSGDVAASLARLKIHFESSMPNVPGNETGVVKTPEVNDVPNASTADAIAALLAKVGKPLTCHEIAANLGTGGAKPYNTVYGIIFNENKKLGEKSRFIKTGKSEFGLR